jgi:hypothetical protein
MNVGPQHLSALLCAQQRARTMRRGARRASPDDHHPRSRSRSDLLPATHHPRSRSRSDLLPGNPPRCSPSAAAAAAATLAKMSAQNKFDMLHGWAGDYVGDVPVITLPDGSTIPALHLHDGPQGVANGNTQVTCWPSALTVVQTWDTAAMAQYGAGMGREQFLKGSNVMLGPGACARPPMAAAAAAAAAAAGGSCARVSRARRLLGQCPR